MTDPRLALALTMESSPGVFALLLGSGVSREAEVPTGWEVTLDLIERLAALEEEDTGGEPAAWYRESYGAPPEYSDILEKVAQTPAERRELLRGYFEPTAEQREQGVKTPSDAHEAIAELVARGYVRVIVTTNFDRLVEQALEAQGVTPTVISTADQANGAPPLVHSDCTVVKVNGDYLDERIRNTPEELAEYPEEIDRLLDRILDEFGLVVCGWSADWDAALRSAIERCPSRRYSTYWTRYEELTDEAERLIQHRDASTIEIDGADEFFTDLAGKVIGLEERAKQHPASVEAAVGTTKRYLSEERHRIRLHDLVMEEANRIHRRVSDDPEDLAAEWDEDEFAQRVARYEDYSEILQNVFAVGCHWGGSDHQRTWVHALERVANPDRNLGRYKPAWAQFQWYPALLLIYAGGISALAAEDYEAIAALLLEPRVTTIRTPRESVPLVREVHARLGIVRGTDVAKYLPGMEGQHSPLSGWLFEEVRESVARVVPQDDGYESIFLWFEYLLALLYVDLRFGAELEAIWGPQGRFVQGWWRGEKREEIEQVVEQQGEEWPPLAAGLFGGDAERFLAVKEAYDEFCWGGTMVR